VKDHKEDDSKGRGVRRRRVSQVTELICSTVGRRNWEVKKPKVKLKGRWSRERVFGSVHEERSHSIKT